MSFFWYQRTGGEEAWHEALSTHRSKVLAEIRPAFVTVLDASAVPETGWAREQYDEVKYSGPFYADWDAESTEEAIKGFLLCLAKLKEMEVDLHSVRLFATGGRGFHLEIPEAIFMPKINKAGVNHLPGIYREMAMELHSVHMDMRVYTGRRGRMWRVPGIERSNGKFKVPLTVDEALNITPESYDALCSAPRLAPVLAEPQLNMALSATYMKCVDKVAKGVKNRAKTSKDRELLAHFNGEFPKSLQRVMAGEGLLPSVGFNQIAMQLAITANAIGKSADDLVKSCEGLIKSHASDGRYNSPRKRKQALIDLWHYTNESDAYSYSRGGIRVLLTPDFPTGDLDGVAVDVKVGTVPDKVEEPSPDPDANQDEMAKSANTIHEGVCIGPSGIYRRTADSWKMLSNVSFINPSLTIDSDDGTTIGIEADIVSNDAGGSGLARHGRQLIPGKAFLSRANLSQFCAARNGVFSGSDTQAGVVGMQLASHAKRGKNLIYVVHREGLDLVQDPMDKKDSALIPMWVAADGVLTHHQDVKFAYSPKMTTRGEYEPDIHHCDVLKDTPETREWLSALFQINEPTVVALMLGWFVSCLHKQYYQRIKGYTAFPLLHPVGSAGSGKSLTTRFLGRLYWNINPVREVDARETTPFVFKGLWASSASLPLIIDEYKPSEMHQSKVDFLKHNLKNAYNQNRASTGGVSRGSADSSFRDMTEYSYSAPTVYIAESQETEPALMQRSIIVSVSPAEARARTRWWEAANKGAKHLPELGRTLLAMTLGYKAEGSEEWAVKPESVESREAALRSVINELKPEMAAGVHDRQVYNLAVVIEGLNFLKRTLHTVFGDRFDGDMELLRAAVYDHKAEIQTQVLSESAKVINEMATITRMEDPDSENSIREGTHYIYGDGFLEILLRPAFINYSAWSRRKGFNPLFPTTDAFIAGMAKFPPVTDKQCFASQLRKQWGAQAKIFRFDLEKLAAEGVELFKSKSLG